MTIVICRVHWDFVRVNPLDVTEFNGVRPRAREPRQQCAFEASAGCVETEENVKCHMLFQFACQLRVAIKLRSRNAVRIHDVVRHAPEEKPQRYGEPRASHRTVSESQTRRSYRTHFPRRNNENPFYFR